MGDVDSPERIMLNYLFYCAIFNTFVGTVNHLLGIENIIIYFFIP